MNQRKSKQLRKLAGGNVAEYDVQTKRKHLGYNPVEQRHLVLTTHLRTLKEDCSRKIYKQLKQEFKTH